jgi:hypothetical protein
VHVSGFAGARSNRQGGLGAECAHGPR